MTDICHSEKLDAIVEWLDQILDSTLANSFATHWRITIMLVAEDVSRPLILLSFSCIKIK